MKKHISVIMLLSIGAFSFIAPAQAANKAGGKCSSISAVVKIGSSKYECQMSSKTGKQTWVKLVKPAGFDCTKSKKALPILRDTFASLTDYMDIVKGTMSETDPFYIKTQKQIDTAAKDLKTLTTAVKKYC
jgi:hypothetical protein